MILKLIGGFKHITVLGFIISFIGTLPFGVLNVLAFSFALNESLTEALFFSFGAVIVELLYVYLTVKALGKFKLSSRISTSINLLIAFFLIYLSYSTFFSTTTNFTQESNEIYKNVPRFLLGIGLSSINLLQIPYWTTWTMLLKEKKMFINSKFEVLKYLIGIGFGTFTGFLVFILLALVLGESISQYQKKIDLIIALLFLFSAIVVFYGIIFKKKNTSNISLT